MNPSPRVAGPNSPALTNGSGAAALLSAGIGCCALSVLAIVADRSAGIKAALVFYKPTGPLSGVTTAAILIWLLTWLALHLRWRRKAIAPAQTNIVAFSLLLLSFLLTFPPIADLF
jgi:hypothetical protein